MSFTFDASDSSFPSDIEKIRILLNDKSQTNYIFEDKELEVFLEMGGDIYEAASLGWKQVAGDKDYLTVLLPISGEQSAYDIGRVSQIAERRAEELHQKSIENSQAKSTTWDGTSQAEKLEDMIS